MSGQAFSGDTGAAADCRMWISRGLWGSSPSSGCKLSGARFSYSGAEFARSWLGSSDLMGLRDLCLTPLPLSTVGCQPLALSEKVRLPGGVEHLAYWSECCLSQSFTVFGCWELISLAPRNPRG